MVVYADSKDLAMRTTSGKVLKDRAYGIALNCNEAVNQRGLTDLCISFLIRKQAQE